METPINLHEENDSFSSETPGFQIAWDSTSLGLIKRCPRLYYYQMIEGWQPKGMALPLIFGIHYHSAMETYDKAKASGLDHKDATREAIRHALQIQEYSSEPTEDFRFLPRDTEDTYRNRETLVRAIVWYLDQFEDDAAKTVILKNGKPAVELTFKMEIPVPAAHEPIFLCGHMDRVVEFGEQIYVMDHKTTKYQVNDRFFSSFSPNNQVSLYTLASTVVLGQSARGVIISACQLAVSFARFARRPIHRTPGQTQEWLRESQEWIENSLRMAEKNYWPMNEESCDKYGGCAFRKICSADPQMRPTLLKSDFYKRVWDPMKAR